MKGLNRKESEPLSAKELGLDSKKKYQSIVNAAAVFGSALLLLKSNKITYALQYAVKLLRSTADA